MKAAICVLLSSFVCMLSGCVPYPHTSERFEGVRGRALDSRTHLPIPGVRVAIHEHPGTHTTTNADGAYRIRPQQNFHILIAPGPCSWSSIPYGHFWSPLLDFSHPGYRPLSFAADEHASRANGNKGERVHADVLLNPR